jgi:hypothetical protein
VIDCNVIRDLEQPAREFEFGPVAVDMVEHLHESVLRKIFRGVAVANDAVNEREDRTLVSSDQFPERCVASFLR